ncbi:MAG: hypothetical protein FWD57_17365, partial [Polyangiaceae bacterium]|nr:hypothetical protein [Polyangiaceae bacterium]
MITPPKLFEDLWVRFWNQMLDLSTDGWIIGVAAIVIAVISLIKWPQRLARFRVPLRWVAVSAICVFAVRAALEMLWIADDAFISFRYARNLVMGHGLVFNPGERVEGYTNFLWTMLMVPAVALDISVGATAVVLGLVSMV